MIDLLSSYKNEYKILCVLNDIFKNSLGPKGKYFIIKYLGRYLIMYETKTLLFFIFNKSKNYSRIVHEVLIHAEEFQDGIKYILVIISEVFKHINKKLILYTSKIKLKFLSILKLILKFVSKVSFFRSRDIDIKNMYNQKKFIKMTSRNNFIDFSINCIDIISTLIYDSFAKTMDTNHLKSINIVNLPIDKSTKFSILHGMIYKSIIKSYKKFSNSTKIAYVKKNYSIFSSCFLKFTDKHDLSKILIKEKNSLIDLMRIFRKNSLNCLLIYKNTSDSLIKFFDKKNIMILQPSNVHILSSIVSLIKVETLNTSNDNHEIFIGIARSIFTRRIGSINYTIIKQYEYLSNKKCMLVNFSNKGFYMIFKIIFFKLLNIFTIATYKARLVIAGGLLEIAIIRYFLAINSKNKTSDDLLLILLDSLAVIPLKLLHNTILKRKIYIEKNKCRFCCLNLNYYDLVKDLLDIFFIKWHSLRTIFLILNKFLQLN